MTISELTRLRKYLLEKLRGGAKRCVNVSSANVYIKVEWDRDDLVDITGPTPILCPTA